MSKRSRRESLSADSPASDDDADTSRELVGEEVPEPDFEVLAEDTLRAIQDGSHPELLERVRAIERQRDKKIAAADRYRKAQIKNINQLYEYEIQDSHSLFQHAYRELQESMNAEVIQERLRLQRAHQKNFRSNDRMASLRSRECVMNGGAMLLTSLLNGTSSNGSNNSNNQKDRSRRRQRDQISTLLQQFNDPIAEKDARDDLLGIVRDLQEQALALERTRPEKLIEEVSVTDDWSLLIIGEKKFSLGDQVNVYSILSQETVTGILCAISRREIIVRTGQGARLSILICQIQAGRVKICHDRTPGTAGEGDVAPLRILHEAAAGPP